MIEDQGARSGCVGIGDFGGCRLVLRERSNRVLHPAPIGFRCIESVTDNPFRRDGKTDPEILQFGRFCVALKG